MRILLIVVLLMIAYDLSIHLIYLFRKEHLFIDKRINYWPNWGGVGHQYQVFRSTFWGAAFVALFIYLLTL